MRITLVCNSVEDKEKLIGRHKYVKKILETSGLGKELSPYRIQILALSRKDYYRREEIAAELQPGYKPSKRKSKSSKGRTSSKKRSRTPLAANTTKSNNKSRTNADHEFIVDDDDTSECSWDSSDDESTDEEQEANTESDDEFDKMMHESDDDASAGGDINLDSDNEKAGENWFGCTCGKDHGTEPGPKL